MLGHRKQLDVREAEVGHVIRELHSELAVAEPLPPRPEVHLVDGERAVHRIFSLAPLEPFGVVPLVV